MKKQLIPFLVFLLFAINSQAQLTLRNNDPKGNFPKIVISKVRTNLFDRTSTGNRLWLYWDKVPKKYENCKEYGNCYEMKVFSSDNLADRTFYLKYHIPYMEQRYQHPVASGFMKVTFVYKDGRPTKTILENFTGDKN